MSAKPNDLGCHGTAIVYFIPPNTAMNGPKYVELFRLKLHMHVHGWHSLSLIKGSHWVHEVKQDLSAEMVRKQPKSQSSQEPVDCYEG